ncbi:hypothetical protein QBC46DRAFT_3773 [Diplogelasinospora grovesii]|uniref:Uncharacterized protein n=1 Tax=Diplogelasinospora grovesii TaxID=303347 RepID=A0AAN6NLL5_9PEZI|nr:hypothetical protein QBC46DRAFT_3773 [Diplogelasinospora grovesii]
MNGTMDGAAKSADKVAKRMLPESPHHLSLSLTRRYPAPSGFWFTGLSGPLQYITYLSDADRGVLLTRPSYEICICDEPEPAPLQTAARVLAKGDVVKKKLSIKDYQNRKKSVSPTDNDPPLKMDAKPNGGTQPKVTKENGVRDEVKAREKPEARQDARQDLRPDKPRQELNGDRARNSERRKEPEAAVATGDSRKRNAGPDDSLPPLKRPKVEVGTPKPDHSRPSKPETPKTRDRTNEKVARKEAKGDSLHPTLNGLPSSKADRERDNTASPRSTIQVNGMRPRSDSGTSTPRKGDGLAKTSVPELLSPLHPSFERELDEHDKLKKKPADKAPVKSPSLAKKHKTTKGSLIPALLSPTLPPIVEAELARLLNESSQSSSQASDSPKSARKTKPVAEPVVKEEDENPRRLVKELVKKEDEQARRPSKLITLKFRKAYAKRAKDLLSLPSKSAKDALKKERSISVEGTPPPGARKRPRDAGEAVSEGTHVAAAKRPRMPATDALAVKPPHPSTPLKHVSTVMSRVASSQSQGNTPGNTTGLTPGASAERPPTRSESTEPISKARTTAESQSYKERHEEYRVLGGTLKHTRDDIHRDRGANITPAEEKRCTALHFEMVLAYMLSFHALNAARMLDRKMGEVIAWTTLIPHLQELKKRVQSNRALKALAFQMHAVCLEQMTLAFTTLDPTLAAKDFNNWRQMDRLRGPTWAEAVTLCDGVDDRRMKTLIGPWTKIDDAVASVLNIMCRWAERDGVQWRPTLMRNEREKVNGAKS